MLRVLGEEVKDGPLLLSGKRAVEEELDPWMLYLYAIKSPATKEKYLMRLGRFLDFVELQELNKNSELEDKARVFAKRGRNDKAWAFNNIIKFIQLQKDRFNQKEINSRVYVPPPDFAMSTSPSHIDIRAGEEKKVSLQIKSNTNTRSEVFLSTNHTDDVELTLSPNKTSIPANGLTTSRLSVKISDNAEPFEYILPIFANMSIPTESRIRGTVGSDIMRNSISANTTENSNFTLTVVPPLSPAEQLKIFYDSWLSPISGIWTFLVGVGAVIVPLIIRLYARKKRKDKKVS